VRLFISQILQAVVLQAKKLGKAVYVFSVDSEGGKVIHVNHLPESLRSKGFDARTWAARVAEILGGKVHSLLYDSSKDIKVEIGWRQRRWRAGRRPQYRQSQGSPRSGTKIST
jgi:hypothetical protein